MRSNFLSFGIAALAIGVGANLSVKYLFSQAPALTPFTVIRLNKEYKLDTGELVRSVETIHALKSDGSSVTLVRSAGPDGEVRDVKSVIDVESKRDVSVDAHTESVSTTYLTEKHALSMRVRDTSCAALSDAQRKTVHGFALVRSERQLPGPPEVTLKVESWLAPALNCFPLEETLFRGQGTTPVRLVSSREATSVTAGEPDPSLFAIPANFKERSPSQVMEEYSLRYPLAKRCEKCSEHYGKMDAPYYAQQKP